MSLDLLLGGKRSNVMSESTLLDRERKEGGVGGNYGGKYLKTRKLIKLNILKKGFAHN